MQARTILIDGDVVAYQAAASVEREIDWGDDLWTLHSDVEEARRIVENTIRSYSERLAADAIIIALSDNQNFRKAVYPDYKSNRADKRKPVALREIRQWMGTNYQTFQRPGLEGDDVLGILATHPTLISGEKVIVSIDKDMKTIPGWVWNPDKDTQPVFIPEQEADYWHLYQTLTGDAVDGYPGCPGTGPKRAEKLLQDAVKANTDKAWTMASACWPAVVEAFVKAGRTETDALTQARCARILRSSDYDFQNKEPILWSPTASSATASPNPVNPALPMTSAA